jgi:hypothetical protein
MTKCVNISICYLGVLRGSMTCPSVDREVEIEWRWNQVGSGRRLRYSQKLTKMRVHR